MAFFFFIKCGYYFADHFNSIFYIYGETFYNFKSSIFYSEDGQNEEKVFLLVLVEAKKSAFFVHFCLV